jgi:D-beta-D-heptose 7-phosphate kinase/D-beta-D-heptose 1-phosphate adenosyltransferase
MAETTADVRRDIELTRNRISDTLQELEHKLNVTQIIKDNPWPALALAVGAGVLLSGSRADVKAAGKIVTADPNPHHAVKWGQITAVKPNRSEALQSAGLPVTDPIDPPMEDKPLLTAGLRLLTAWDTQMLLITLGEQGMMLLERNQPPHHIPTKARQVFDVSGAGDTAIALFTLALACDATPIEAAEIANHASAVVVAKLGTATLTPAELIASFEDDHGA